MARMHPDDIEDYDEATEGEKSKKQRGHILNNKYSLFCLIDLSFKSLILCQLSGNKKQKGSGLAM